MLISEILPGAADAIEQRGLAKGWYVDDFGALCAQGAMFVAIGVEPQVIGVPSYAWAGRRDWSGGKQEAMDAVLDARLALDNHLGENVVLWNDAPGRTEEEVVAALRAAAAAEHAAREVPA